MLFELCPDTKQRCVGFKGIQKDANNIKKSLKVLNECGDKIPRFVSHYLDELPPVTINNLDVSQACSARWSGCTVRSPRRHAVKLQANVENLCSVTETIGSAPELMLMNAGWNRATEEDRLSRLGRIARSWLGSWLVGASLALLRIPFVSALLYHLARSWRRERLCRGRCREWDYACTPDSNFFTQMFSNSTGAQIKLR